MGDSQGWLESADRQKLLPDCVSLCTGGCLTREPRLEKSTHLAKTYAAS